MTDRLTLAPLTDSSDLIGHPAALQARFAEDGYLLLRGVIDPELVAWARQKYRDALTAEDLIDPAVAEPVWTGKAPKTRRPCDAVGASVWQAMTAQPKLNAVMLAVLGEPVTWLPIAANRSGLPTGPVAPDQDVFEARHQDGFFNEGMNFTICWIPLMDIDMHHGSFAIAPRTHHQGFIHAPDAPHKIPAGTVPDAQWRSIDYKVGDLLIFNDLVVHGAMPNPSDHIRLSLDVRAVRHSAPQPIVGTVRQVDGAAVEIETETGERVTVTVSDRTYIRDMDPRPRVPTAEVGRLAYPGSHILVMAGGDGAATVLRRNFY